MKGSTASLAEPPAAAAGSTPAGVAGPMPAGIAASTAAGVARRSNDVMIRSDGGASSSAGSAQASPNVAPDSDMIAVPAGSFTMGADRGGQEDEHPAHTVDLAGFLLDRTEVTNEDYDRCVAAGVCRPHDPASARNNHFGSDEFFRAPRQPISAVSWDDARTYCQWRGKRFPREAEWEKAARGTDARRYPWGNDPPTPDRAVFATSRTAEVGTHPAGAGPYGHLDLAGNVWEWTADIYDPYAYRRPSAGRGIPGTCDEVLAAQNELRRKGKQGFTGSNPIPTECEHVLRGGAFNYDGPGLRASNRVHHPACFRLVMAGFRCAKDLPAQ